MDDDALRTRFIAEVNPGLKHLALRVEAPSGCFLRCDVVYTGVDANDTTNEEWFSWPLTMGSNRSAGQTDAEWRAQFMTGVAETCIKSLSHEVFEFLRGGDGARIWSPHGEDGETEHPLTGMNCPVVSVDVLALQDALCS